MKTLVVLVALLMGSVYCHYEKEEEEGCSLKLFPSFKLKVNQSFPVIEGCVKFTCRRGNLFEITDICPTLCRSCPPEEYDRVRNEYGERILSGRICDYK